MIKIKRKKVKHVFLFFVLCFFVFFVNIWNGELSSQVINDAACQSLLYTLWITFFSACPYLYYFYREKERDRLIKKYNNKDLCEKLLFNERLENLYDKYKVIELAELLQDEKMEILYDKYRDIEVVMDIKKEKIWIGMTKDMLIDSWGEPDDTTKDVSISKVKYDNNGQPDAKRSSLLNVKETYKYGVAGKNRYRNYVYLKNDIVTGYKL